MLQITRVDILDGQTLDIELNNGSIVLLALAVLYEFPGYEALKEDDRILCPRTTGQFVYWRDGPSLKMEEIMKLSFQQGKDEK
ncbi:hypothetical protein [Anaerocolumna xylanovorans]|uniref:DUF2442 domain-containing protein n=1 Tax=Anaerocolumna xylanovorans DSM 12503 TaxID=1121345 RepID=A0A1M7XWJ8_9FIRM|nr:hypothetical protein [Anaerocolumna xylanovorans]SHO43165.1 hypothetical protein SAMN02745217_00114 [Anaerocolumna xylanovorans DSM 12503]